MRANDWYVTKDFGNPVNVKMVNEENEEILLLEAMIQSFEKRVHSQEAANAARIMKRIIKKIK